LLADSGFHASHESWGEGLPLGVHTQVVIESLVLEKHVLVSPLRGHKLRIHSDLADELLGASQLNRLVHGVDSIESLSCRHLLQSFLQVERGRVLYGGHVRRSRFKAKLRWEDRLLHPGSILRVIRVVRESHRPGEVRLNSEVREALEHSRIHGLRNLVRQTVLEEVKTVLAIQAILGDDIGRVDSVAEELDADAWGHVLSRVVDLSRRAETNEAIVASSEHTGVRMVSQADPGGLGHVADAVEGFFAAVKLITLLIEGRSWFDLEVLTRVPVSALRVSCNLLPDDFMLGRARQGKVFGALGHPVVRNLLINN